MMEKPYFWDWAVFNDEAELIGVAPDAPQKAKESYKQYMEMMAQAEEDLVKL